MDISQQKEVDTGYFFYFQTSKNLSPKDNPLQYLWEKTWPIPWVMMLIGKCIQLPVWIAFVRLFHRLMAHQGGTACAESCSAWWPQRSPLPLPFRGGCLKQKTNKKTRCRYGVRFQTAKHDIGCGEMQATPDTVEVNCHDRLVELQHLCKQCQTLVCDLVACICQRTLQAHRCMLYGMTMLLPHYHITAQLLLQCINH